MYNITYTISGNVPFDSTTETVTIPCEGGWFDIIVRLNGNQYNHSFTCYTTSEWFTIKRFGNRIHVNVLYNNLEEWNYGYVRILDNTDLDNYVDVTVVQEPSVFDMKISNVKGDSGSEEYPINNTTFTYELDTLLDIDEYYDETLTFTMNVIGGRMEFRVRSIREYVVSDLSENDSSSTFYQPTGSEGEWYEVPYDNGLITKIEGNQFTVKSCGIANLYYDTRYIITLCHKNKRTCTCTITLDYAPERDESQAITLVNIPHDEN